MIIDAEGIVKRYGEKLALDHFSMQVNEGEIFGLLGPNGSGKTTAIGCILGLLTFDKGNVRVFGEPMLPDSYASKRQVGVVPQEVAVFNELTVEQNVRYFCGLYVPEKARRHELVEAAIEFAGLGEFRRYLPRKLSGGLLRRLNIACGVVHKPRLLILDEPTVAVDPQSRNSILEGVRALNRAGTTVVYTTHYMEEAEQLCHRIMIMDRGRAVAAGTREALTAMIGTGEKITVELGEMDGESLAALRALPLVQSAEHAGGELTVHCKSGAHNLLAVLDFLRARALSPGRVYSEPPTLNDVFLEITGRELRD